MDFDKHRRNFDTIKFQPLLIVARRTFDTLQSVKRFNAENRKVKPSFFYLQHFSVPREWTRARGRCTLTFTGNRRLYGDFPKRGRLVCGEFRVGVCLGLDLNHVLLSRSDGTVAIHIFPDFRNFTIFLFRTSGHTSFVGSFVPNAYFISEILFPAI